MFYKYFIVRKHAVEFNKKETPPPGPETTTSVWPETGASKTFRFLPTHNPRVHTNRRLLTFRTVYFARSSPLFALIVPNFFFQGFERLKLPRARMGEVRIRIERFTGTTNAGRTITTSLPGRYPREETRARRVRGLRPVCLTTIGSIPYRISALPTFARLELKNTRNRRRNKKKKR